MRTIGLLLFVLILVSCANNNDLERINAELKDSIAILNQQIKDQSLLYKFEKVKNIIIPKEQKFRLNQPNELLLLVVGNELRYDGAKLNLAFDIRGQLKSNIETVNENGINILHYTPLEVGIDTLKVNFLFQNSDGESISFPGRFTIKVE